MFQAGRACPFLDGIRMYAEQWSAGTCTGADVWLILQTTGVPERRLPNPPEAWGVAVWLHHWARHQGAAADDLAQGDRPLGLRHRPGGVPLHAPRYAVLQHPSQEGRDVGGFSPGRARRNSVFTSQLAPHAAEALRGPRLQTPQSEGHDTCHLSAREPLPHLGQLLQTCPAGVHRPCQAAIQSNDITNQRRLGPEGVALPA